jgi:hypothetical protein
MADIWSWSSHGLDSNMVLPNMNDGYELFYKTVQRHSFMINGENTFRCLCVE